MRIVILQIWHGEKMGYIDNFLPRALARLGHDVHLVTTNVQPYFNSPDYAQTYEPYFGPPVVPCCVTRRPDGVTLHRLPHCWLCGKLRMRGLYAKLKTLRPDVVQGFEVNSRTTHEAALHKPRLGYKLFLESHVHASVFSPARGWLSPSQRAKWALYRATIGKPVSAMTTKCYPISADAADIAIRFYGMNPDKVEIGPLGTDTQMFRPLTSPADLEARRNLRAQLGFSEQDVVCIYTGRLSRAKGPTILADAISGLAAAGEPFRGLFVGHGEHEYTARIAHASGCVLHPFVPATELPPLYRAADIAVWPKQESTSQLDAAASGLPLILNDGVQVTERIDGNGLTYTDGDSDDLAKKLLSLKEPDLRHQMATIGRRHMVEQFDWRLIAKHRAEDYQAALRGEHCPAPTTPVF